MSPESDKLRATFVDQLASFESKLDEKVDDIAMLADIQEAIGRLLDDNGTAEAEIRRILQDRYEKGDLRKETFQLVKSMLDRYVTEQAPTSPGVTDDTVRIEPQIEAPAVAQEPPETPRQDDSLSSTMVMSAQPQAETGPGDSRVQVGSVLRDRFMLQEQVSGGSMGIVYKAMDRRLAEAGSESPDVAIKVLSSKLSESGLALRALQQEAAKGRCLVHPNIVRFIDLDRDDELYFIVMEWLDGRTLADILDSPDSKSIDTDRAFAIVRQIGKALDYAHKCGIVHADVKPGNIMIMPNGDAKLFDFGVARVRQKQLDKDPGFDPGVLGLLTPAYSSMQVLTGEKPEPSDDVFSLACLLYRLIAGYRVFGPRNAAEAAEEGMKPQRLDKLSDENWKVLKKALSYSRVTRFQSMAEFIDSLDARTTEAITVDIPAPERFQETEESRGHGRAILGLVVLFALAGVVSNQMGWLDLLKEQFLPQAAPVVLEEPEIAEFEAPVEEELPADSVATVADDAAAEEPIEEAPLAEVEVEDELVVESESEEEVLEPEEPVEVPEPEVPEVPLVDFSTLPPPTASVVLAEEGGSPGTTTVRLREDREPATVDLVRHDVEFPLTVRVEEIAYSGNRSPWSAGQYEFSDNGIFEFPVGQNRARVTLTMASDPVREADQQSTLRVRLADTANSELATINVLLEDDDQRAFEATLPRNTVAFATSQVSVREQDPAVQLDILRFNPDSSPLVVGYVLRDITATQGEDYFAPGKFTIEFGPNQRSTRLLIPLVQDSTYEDNEAFSVELSLDNAPAGADVFQRVAVLIRDDDQ